MDAYFPQKENTLISRAVPHFLSVGHICYDLRERGKILGGSALYSALLARNLGYTSAIVTSVGKDFSAPESLESIQLAAQVSKQTTTFINKQTQVGRDQVVESAAAPIRKETIPEQWFDSKIVYFCPILNDFEPSIIANFSGSLVGIAPQGWMRKVGKGGRVVKQRFSEMESIVPRVNFVIISEEDVFDDELDELIQLSPILALTRGRKGAELYWQGGRYHEHIPAFERDPVDDTGAGDVFGAAFLLRYFETGDLIGSATFASCAASFIVEGEGTSAMPRKQDIMTRITSITT